MPNILCFGDSNTFGTNPAGGRHPRAVRWPGRLQALLGSDYYVIEEGCGGRTTVHDDPIELHKNGRLALPVALASHKPLDLVILMLGTNDWKARFSLLPCDVAAGVMELVRLVRTYPYGDAYPVPRVLVVSPILLGEDIEHSIYGGFSNEAVPKSAALAPLLRRAALDAGCLFFDAAAVARPSPLDRLHMDAESHEALAEALAGIVRGSFA